MTAVWPTVADPEFDLGDIARHTFRPFQPDEFPTRRDPALDAEPTTEQLLAECAQIRADLTAAVTRSKRARGADTDLREVA